MSQGSLAGAGDSVAQRVVAGALRGALALLLRPVFQAGRPVEQQRRRLAAVARTTLVPRGVRFTQGQVGGVSGEWAIAKSGEAASRAVLYLHGGAYCVGSPGTHRAITAQLALRCRMRVFAADYRLAPEHPFPAAVDDAVAAYAALLGDGGEPAGVALAGDSAGGGLCVAAALRLRDLGLPQPSALVLFSPWVDLADERRGEVPPGEALLTPSWLAECAGFYLAGRNAREPQASPLFAELGGLPRTLIQVGTDELLLPDAERLHVLLEASGVPSTLRIYPQRWHVFQMHAGLLRDADRALDAAAAFVAD